MRGGSSRGSKNQSQFFKKKKILGTSLVTQWLSLRAPNAGGQGLIPGQGTRAQMLQLRLHTAK